MTIEEIAADYRSSGSIVSTATALGISQAAVRKALITTGDYSSPTSDQVQALAEQGHSPAEICKLMGISKSAVNANLPYSKGTYLSEDKSPNAIRIRACRERKASKSE